MSRHELPRTARSRGWPPAPAGQPGPGRGGRRAVAAGRDVGDAAGDGVRAAARRGGTDRGGRRAASCGRWRNVAEAAPFWDAAAAVLVGSDIRELPPRRTGARRPGRPQRRRGPAVAPGRRHRRRTRRSAARRRRLARRVPQPRPAHRKPGGLVLGIVGGCGGAGATTAAIWLAQAAARERGACPAGGRRPVGRRAGTGAGRRGNARAPLAGPGRGQRQHRSPPAGRFPAPGRRILLPVLAREPGTATAGWTAAVVAGVLDAARRGYELVVRGHRPGTGTAADLRLGLRPDDRRCARAAAGCRGHGPAAAGASSGGDCAGGAGQTAGPRWMRS